MNHEIGNGNESVIEKASIEQTKDRNSQALDILLNNGVSKDTPNFETINQNKYC